MAVYVDTLRAVKRSSHWPFPEAAHMIADSLPELHAFARKIGLRKAWFQERSYPHYDLHRARHELALRHGATEVSRHELVLVIRRIRNEQKETRKDAQENDTPTATRPSTP